MISTRMRWQLAAAAAVAAVVLGGCGSSASAGSPGNWTQAQKTTFAGLGYFGDGAAFTNCVRAGMERTMSVTDATRAFNAIPSGATSKAQITSAISAAVGGSDGSSVANTFYSIATSCNSQYGAAAPAATATAAPTASPGTPGNWSAAQKSQFLAAAGSSDNAAMAACLAAAEENAFTYTDMMAVANATPSGGFTSQSQLIEIMVELFGSSKGDQVAQTLISQATTCQTQTGSSAASAPSTSPVAPSATPSSSATAAALTPWTQAQRQQLTDAYDADHNLSSLSLACLQVTISQQVQAVYALEYVKVIWVIPAPPYDQVLTVLQSAYGAAEGQAIYTAWRAVTTAVNDC